MRPVEPDFTRRIDLPGIGPCPRPIDLDRASVGCEDLVSLRVYAFAAGMVVEGEAEGDEVLIAAMRGEAEIAIEHAGERTGPFPLRGGDGRAAAYLPPHASYRLTASQDCAIAYARACPSAERFPPPAGFTGTGTGLAVVGHAVGMELLLDRIPAGGTLDLDGPTRLSPERFVHVRTDGNGAGVVDGIRFKDWTSALVSDGEAAAIRAEGGSIDVLVVSATARRAGSADE